MRPTEEPQRVDLKLKIHLIRKDKTHQVSVIIVKTNIIQIKNTVKLGHNEQLGICYFCSWFATTGLFV